MKNFKLEILNKILCAQLVWRGGRLLFIFFLVGMCGLVKAQSQPLTVKDSLAVKEYFFQGIIEKMSENYVKANATFSKILQLDPASDATHFEIANLYFRQEKLVDAEIAIKRALTINPQQIWYLKLQSEIYKRSGNMQAIIPVFNLLIELDPERESYYFDRANALFIAGEVENSHKAYNALEQKFGVSEASITAKKRFEQNSRSINNSHLQKLIIENPTDVKNHLQLSGLLLAENKNEEALVYLQKASQQEPDNYEVNLALADIYYALKQNDKAFNSLKLAFGSVEMPQEAKLKILDQILLSKKPEALKNAALLCELTLGSEPEHAGLLQRYGDVLYRQGDLKAAKFQYVAALKSGQPSYPAWEKLLAVQTLMGSYEEAIKTADEALSIYPNQAILQYYSAFALHRNGQNAEAGLALKYANQLAAGDDQLMAMVLALQAEVLIDQGKFKEADAAFAKAIVLAPQNYLTMSNYAYFLALRNHDLNKAQKFAQDAVVALPKDASVLDTYAVVLFKLNRFDEALNYVQKALQNNETDNAVYLEHYGDILFAKGDKENAILQWQKSKQSGNLSKNLVKKINEKRYIK